MPDDLKPLASKPAALAMVLGEPLVRRRICAEIAAGEHGDEVVRAVAVALGKRCDAMDADCAEVASLRRCVQSVKAAVGVVR